MTNLEKACYISGPYRAEISRVPEEFTAGIFQVVGANGLPVCKVDNYTAPINRRTAEAIRDCLNNFVPQAREAKTESETTS